MLRHKEIELLHILEVLALLTRFHSAGGYYKHYWRRKAVISLTYL